MANVELAAAYVALVPSLQGAGKVIEKELGGVDVSPAAEKVGKNWSSAFDGVLGKAGPISGGVLAAAFTKGFSLNMEKADAMASLNAQMALSADESAKAGDVAGSLYASAYGESMSDVTTAVGAVMSSMSGMRDASAADIEAITAQAMSLADVFEVDIAEATQVAGRLMSEGLAGDASQAMDLIAGSMQQIPANIRGEVLPVMDEYAGYFSQLGIDGETAMGMIVKASESGALGMDKLGDSLKEFTIRATDMSTSTQDAYSRLGLSTQEMTTALLAGGEQGSAAMGQIVSALQGVEDPAEQAQIALALFGTPLEDLGTDKIPAFLNALNPATASMGEFEGAAQSVADSANSGPGAAFTELKRTAESLFASFSEKLLPAFQGVADFFTENEWAFTALATAIGVTLVGAFTSWAGSIIAANLALLANPITWVVAGITALIGALALLVVNWDSVKAWIEEKWAATVQWLKDSWQAVKDKFTEIGEAIKTYMSELWEKIKTNASEVWENIKTTVSNAWQAVKDKTTEVWDLIKTTLSNAWQSIKDTASNKWSDLKNFFSNTWDNIKTTAVNKWNSLVDFVKGIPQKFLNGLREIANLRTRMSQWVENISKAAKDKFNSLISWVKGVPQKIVNALGNVGSLLWNAGSQILSGLWNGMKSAWNNVSGWLSDLGSKIRNLKGPEDYDKALLIPAGGWIMGGLQKGMNEGFEDVVRDVKRMAPAISDAFGRVAVQSPSFSLLPAQQDYLPASAGEEGRIVVHQHITHALVEPDSKLQSDAAAAARALAGVN